MIPFGGGTSVSEALECPSEEGRCIVSPDMSRMSRLLWLDQSNLVARAEAGIVGLQLEKVPLCFLFTVVRFEIKISA